MFFHSLDAIFGLLIARRWTIDTVMRNIYVYLWKLPPSMPTSAFKFQSGRYTYVAVLPSLRVRLTGGQRENIGGDSPGSWVIKYLPAFFFSRVKALILVLWINWLRMHGFSWFQTPECVEGNLDLSPPPLKADHWCWLNQWHLLYVILGPYHFILHWLNRKSSLKRVV